MHSKKSILLFRETYEMYTSLGKDVANATKIEPLLVTNT